MVAFSFSLIYIVVHVRLSLAFKRKMNNGCIVAVFIKICLFMNLSKGAKGKNFKSLCLA